MLSKSQYVRGLQCHKSLWLYKNQPELRVKPNAQQQSKFDTGHLVGGLACQLFPGGVEIQFDPNNYEGMAKQTNSLIEQGVEVIYEATFIEKGVFAMVDILVKNGDSWDLYEVKSSTNVKDYHQDDAAVQWYALSNKVKLNRAFIVHINNQYERQGKLDLPGLFSICDVTEVVVNKQQDIQNNINSMEDMIVAEKPSVEIATKCHSPHECDFIKHCWKNIPTPSVFDLYRMRSVNKFELYQKGIVTFEDIPSHQKLSEIQQVQVQASLLQKEFIDKDIIESFFSGLTYPLHFFDFETFQDAVPRFDGQKPFMQVPFQYSLHILHENGELEHKEFLGDENSDPRETLIESMVEDIFPSGTIVAFNQGFEKGVIKALANSYTEHHKLLMDIHGRFVDLIDPFRQLGYYHPDFNGSFSIKSILPAMFPNDAELDYKKLEIQNGGMAMDVFANLHRIEDRVQVEKIRKDLLAYCHLDTLAMVRIYQKLRLLH